MKKVNKLIEDIGFRPEASKTVKTALIQHILRNSEGAPLKTNRKVNSQSQQLSFDFFQEQSAKKEKVS